MSAKEKRPNILFLMTDQHRYDCVGFSEKYPVKTPNLDRLASEGVWFDHAYCTVPTCCPARQSFISGKRPERFGGHWNYDNYLKVNALPVDEFSFARALKEVGYQTAYVGKWHVSAEHTPLDFGFDEYYSLDEVREYHRSKGYDKAFRSPNEYGMEMWLGHTLDIPYEEATPHLLASKAIEMLQRMHGDGRPFFLVYSTSEPHLPCCPSEPFAGMFKPEDAVKWGGFDDTFEDKPYIQKQMLLNWTFENLTWEDWSKCVARYYACIAQVDDAMGRILKTAEALDTDNNTVMIYTADHGDMCGSHRMPDKHYVMYDDVVRVPMIVKWKDHFAPGRSSDFVHNFLDLHCTILELAGAKGDTVCDGKSLMNQLQGHDEGRKYAVSTYNGQQCGLYNQRMIRSASYKYIWNMTDVDELYDMEKDPYELTNQVHNPEYTDILKEMRLQLYRELEKNEDRLLLRSTPATVHLLQNKKL